MSPLKVTVEDVEHGQITIITGGIIRTFHTGPREVVEVVDEVQELAGDVAAAAAWPARPQRYPCSECGRSLSEHRAIKGYNCPEHVDHVLMRAREAHDAFAKTNGPQVDADFDRLTDKQREAWRAAAATVIEAISG